jgi:hypothetical protein
MIAKRTRPAYAACKVNASPSCDRRRRKVHASFGAAEITSFPSKYGREVAVVVPQWIAKL